MEELQYAVVCNLAKFNGGGDFNNDGILDIAIADSTNNDVQVFLGDGSGGFTAASTLTLTFTPAAISVSDLNGDGVADLVVSSQGSYFVKSFLGTGNGSFTLAGTLSTNCTFQTAAILDDFDGDGVPDLFIGCQRSSQITLYHGNGDGTFQQKNSISIPNAKDGVYQSLVAVGDFNGDGLVDLAVASQATDTLTICLGDGNGGFGGYKTTQLSSIPMDIVTGDFNGDGKLDVAASLYYSTLAILPGNGDGTFSAPQNATATYGPIGIGDFNGDGIADLAMFHEWPDVILLGKGDGTYTPLTDLPAIGCCYELADGDFNGDGITDLATIYDFSEYDITAYLAQPPVTSMTAAVDNIQVSGPGPHQIVASYSGDSNYSQAESATTPIYALTATPTMSPAPGTFTSYQTVTISDATHGALIYYTTDGTTPTTSSTVYSGAIAIKESETLHAIAVANGYAQSAVAAANYTLNLPVASTPTFSLQSGVYTSIQTLAISDSSVGASIYYTVDGSTPSAASTPYTGPITIASTKTVKAIATGGTGYLDSNVASLQLTINLPAAAAPVISPNGGIYSSDQTVSITDQTSGATICYTTNGVAPFFYTVTSTGAITCSGTIYSGTITVSSAEVLQAVAIATGYSSSIVTSAQYLFSGQATQLIYTVAGDGMTGYTGDGGLATLAQIGASFGVAFDSGGNLYFSDTNNNVIRRIDATTGNICTIAGTGVGGFGGDGGPATQAQFFSPSGLVFDAAGDLYIADTLNNRIRRIDAKSGHISTVIGDGPFAISSTGSTQLLQPRGVAVDDAGNLYIAGGHGVLEVSVATNTNTWIVSTPFAVGVAVDKASDVFVLSGSYTSGYFTYNASIYKIPAGTTVNSYPPLSYYCIVACGGILGGTAKNTFLYSPESIAVDASGNLYIADTGHNVVQKVTVSTNAIANVTSLAANRETGDGGLPVAAGVVGPLSLAVDGNGNLAITDESARIRKIIAYSAPPASTTATPTFSVAEGSYSGPQTVTISDATPGASIYYTLDGSTPTTASGGYFGPINVGGTVTVKAIAVAQGYLPSAAASTAYTITSTPVATISTMAGSGSGNYTYCNNITQGTSVQALQGAMGQPQDVALDSAGNLYVLDSYCNAVWKVAAQTRTIALYAGTGLPYSYGYATLGDGGPATSAILSAPRGISLDRKGNLYIADTGDNLVRKVDASTGLISSVAGNGSSFYSSTSGNGDGGAATSATVAEPVAVTLDNAGNLYISDYWYRVREVASSTGIITTVAGNGTFGYGGDGGSATSAELESVNALATDGAGNLYLVESAKRIREVAASTGIITTVAGNGTAGYSGDGGKATQAQITANGLAADPQGNLYLSNGNIVRFVLAADGTVSTIAGSGIPGYWGDGGAATVAGLHSAAGLAFDSLGNLYIADTGNGVVRQVAFASNPAQTALPSFTPAAGTYVGTQSVTITDTTSSANIYYTTDGTTPTTGSTRYTAPIAVSSSATIQAIATASGFFNSRATAASYTILTPQTINFTVPSNTVTYGVAPITLSATATSGLAVVFSVQSGPAAVNGSELTITGAGTVVVAANQSGNSIYGAAPQVTQTIVVNQATPTITWAMPAAIAYGTALSSAQLNATASVPGTFVYDPAAGAVPAVGIDTLSVIFTPANAVDFAKATATVKLTVNPGVPMLSTLSPSYSSAGGSSFTLTVTGSGFTSASIIYWGTTALATTYGSATQLTAQVAAAEIAAAGTAAITVQTPSPGGGTSNSMTFEVDSAASGSSSGPTFTTVAATVSAGATATYPVTLPPTATNISVTCLNLPVGATCSYSSSTGAVTVATSSNTPAGSYQITVVFTETVPVTAGYLLPLLLLPLVFRRKKLTSNGNWAVLCLGAVLLASTVFALGCGGSSSSSSGPQKQQVKHSGTVTLTVR